MILFIPNMFSNARNVQGFAVWGGLFIALWTAMQPDELLLSQNEICISYTIVLIAFTGTINIIRIKKVFPFSSLQVELHEQYAPFACTVNSVYLVPYTFEGTYRLGASGMNDDGVICSGIVNGIIFGDN